MLEIQNLSFTYDGGTEALQGVSLQCPPGEVFAILGQSGSGKTTLLKCIGRFIRPMRGSILLDGDDIHLMEEKAFRQKLGIVFQGLHLFPHLSILENMVLAPVKVLGADRDAMEAQAAEMLERLGVGEITHRYPAQISGGQAQRAAIIRGLMLQPEYLLLDEPTAALDINTTDAFAEWLLELREYTTFIVVTHDVPFAAKVAERGIILTDGQIQAEGNVEHLTAVLQGNGQ